MIRRILNFLYDLKPLPKGFKRPKVQGYLNPMGTVECLYKGKTFFKQPFHLIIYTHLKEYGFDPDGKVDDPPVVIYSLGPDWVIPFKLLVKDPPKDGFFGKPLTPEEAIKRGYILNKMRPPLPLEERKDNGGPKKR